MTEGKKEILSFSDRLRRLLNNKEFKNLVNSIADEAEDINYNEYKEEMLQLRQLNLKKKRENKITNQRLKTSNNEKENEEKDSIIDNINQDEQIHPVIFFYINKNKNKKMYTYHKTYKEYYYLRCTDRQCSGTAKYNQINGNIEEMAKCSKLYENHNYVRESLIKKSLRRLFRGKKRIFLKI